MKLLGLFTVVALVMGGGIGLLSTVAGQKEGADKKALEKLQGKWETVSVTEEGKDLKEDEIKVRSLEIKGEKITFPREGKPGTISIKIDPSQSPAHFDGTYDDGPLKGVTGKGIYKLDGDKLIICSSGPGKDRPTEFASKPGSGTILRVYKRAK